MDPGVAERTGTTGAIVGAAGTATVSKADGIERGQLRAVASTVPGECAVSDGCEREWHRDLFASRPLLGVGAFLLSVILR